MEGAPSKRKSIGKPVTSCHLYPLILLHALSVKVAGEMYMQFIARSKI